MYKKILSMLIIIIILLAISSDGSDRRKTHLSSEEKLMFELINRERIMQGIKKLEVSAELCDVARKYALELAKYNYISHISIVDGSTPLERVLRSNYYKYYIGQIGVGENLARANALDIYNIHKMFMDSREHAENILNPRYNEVGIAIIHHNNTTYYVVLFAYRKNFLKTIIVVVAIILMIIIAIL